MLQPRLLLRSLLLCIASLTVAASLASASHVAPVLPLTSGSNHEHEKFTGMAFPPADLSFIVLAFADLSSCSFAPGTNLTNANFTGANLTNANLSGCIIDGASFRGANLSNAAMPCAGIADFRGAILQGVIAPPGQCSQCSFPGPNLKDQCTLGDVLSLCMVTAPFRGVVSGVVFVDGNSNGILDFGEAGVPGVNLLVTPTGAPAVGVTTDGRGAYVFFSTTTGPASVVLDTNTLPGTVALVGPALQSFDLTNCRSGQERNFPVHNISTPAKKLTFGGVKTIYR